MSKLQKSLPKVSGIAFVDKELLTRKVSIQMPFAGVVPQGIQYVSWKQNSFSYSYQAQYKIVARLSPTKNFQTGVEESQTGWKYFNPNYSGPVDSLDKGAKADPLHDYFRYYSIRGKHFMTKGSYDKLDFMVRVRSFNSSKKLHGEWVQRTLTIVCVPDVTIHKIVARADGGMNIYFDTHGWLRGHSTFEMTKLVVDDVNILKAKFTDEIVAIGEEEAREYPYVIVNGDKLSGDVTNNQSIKITGKFITCDGASDSVSGTYTTDPVSAVIDAPVIVKTINNYDSTVTIDVKKSDRLDDWDDVSCYLKTADKKRYDAVAVEKLSNEGRRFTFQPPFDVDCNMVVHVTNNLAGEYAHTYKNYVRLNSEGKVVINYNDGTDDQVVAMNYDVMINLTGKRSYEKELPFGRSKPIGFLGEGVERSITINGSIDGTDTGELQTVANSSYTDWLMFQQNLGLVNVRCPKGKSYKGICHTCNISQEDEFDDGQKISINIEEVS